MQTHLNKERKHIHYLHITHNKQALQTVSPPLFPPHAYSTRDNETDVLLAWFLFLGLLAWFRLSTGNNETDVCKKNSRDASNK